MTVRALFLNAWLLVELSQLMTGTILLQNGRVLRVWLTLSPVAKLADMKRHLMIAMLDTITHRYTGHTNDRNNQLFSSADAYYMINAI